ncbi:MAG TPA: hypothetical protein VFQ84_07490 [Arenimonas sp.]|uniref:hypothetical protein n=1 Tax=Arenimonas sp. TaxID=1872635 RepID=UPI002D8077D7|nr:hypothetical protein [Arenimonas sp.]HEU0153170.1 hypothetical protein [Arenimonas sp.]
MRRSTLLMRLGALSYLIWGALHLVAGWRVFTLAATVPADMVQGRLEQAGWNLGCMAAAAMAVAVTMNWRSSLSGYWINAVLISVTDLGFLLFVLLPGYMPWQEGLMGPAFWIVGLILTTAGLQAPATRR